MKYRTAGFGPCVVLTGSNASPRGYSRRPHASVRGSAGLDRRRFWLLVALGVGTVALPKMALPCWRIRNRRKPRRGNRVRLPAASEQWIETVCERGTYQNGQGRQRPDRFNGAARCYGLPRGTLFIGTYDSKFRFDNAVARFGERARYATLTDDSGQLWVFFLLTG